MPNLQNINAPITLISLDRSGTTLTSKLFDYHPECVSYHETANLLFWAWLAVETPGINPLIENNSLVPEDERAGRMVRQAFLTCFPDDRPYWFHKPIRIPNALIYRYPEENQWPEAAEWYWKIMKASFPQARFFTVLRHPCDVVLSQNLRSQRAPAEVWKDLGFMAYILTHPASPVEYAVPFERLVQQPEAMVKELFGYVQIPFDRQVLTAFDKVHAPSPGRDSKAVNLVSRRDEWEQLDPGDVYLPYFRSLEILFKKFEQGLLWPAHFTIDNFVTVKPPDTLVDIERNYKGVLESSGILRKKYIFLAKERHLRNKALRRVNAGLRKQKLNWQELAKKRQTQNVKLKQQNSRLKQLVENQETFLPK